MNYNRQQVINDIVAEMMEALHDPKSVVKSSPTKDSPYISIRKTFDIGTKNSPIVIVETQDLEPFENKSKIYVDLGSTKLRAIDGIFNHIYASTESEFRFKLKRFLNDSWYYIQNGLEENRMKGKQIKENKHITAKYELFRAFNYRSEGIAGFQINIGPVEDARISWETNDDDTMNAKIIMYYMDDDTTKEVNQVVTGENASDLADNVIYYIEKDYYFENRMKGKQMKNKRYMKEGSSSWDALISIAEVVLDRVLNSGYSGKVDMYDALPYDYYGPLKDFVGNTEGYDYVKYKLGDQTDDEGATMITLTVNGKSWDTFIFMDGNIQMNYNKETVASALENLLPSDAMSESRRRASSRSYYRESTGYTINNIQSPLVKAILKNDKVTKEFNVSLPLNGIPGVDTVVAKGKIGGKIEITANKGSKVVYAPYKGKLTAKTEEDIDESVHAFVRHIKDNVLNDFDRSGPDVRDNTKNFGKTYKFESRGGSLASYKYFKESLERMVKGTRRLNERGNDFEGQLEDALYSGKNDSFYISTGMTPIAEVDLYVENLSGGDIKAVIHSYEIHTPSGVHTETIGFPLRGNRYNMEDLVDSIVSHIKYANNDYKKDIESGHLS